MHSLNRFETTSRGGFGESGSIRIQWSVRTRRNWFEPIPLSQCGLAFRHNVIDSCTDYKTTYGMGHKKFPFQKCDCAN